MSYMNELHAGEGISNMNGTLEIHGDKRCVWDLRYGMQDMWRNA